MNFNQSLSGVFYGEAPSSIAPPAPPPDLWEWVEEWIKARYGSNRSGPRYGEAWRSLKSYFAAKGITVPTRGQCQEYVLFRNASKTTACMELRILSVILNEAKSRGLIKENTASRLGFGLPKGKRRTEIPRNVLDEIEAAIEQHRFTSAHQPSVARTQRFLRLSFALGRYHGVRLSETRLPLEQVNFKHGTISFHMKGDRWHTVPLHPKVRPLLEKLRDDGEKWTYERPDYIGLMSNLWSWFLRRNGFVEKVPGISFHCLRHTAASAFARANISQAKAQRFLNHSSSSVHEAYIHVEVSDLGDCLAAL